MNPNILLKICIVLILIFQATACSTMGSVAKRTFQLGTDLYRAQPNEVKSNYPQLFKQTFFTGALVIAEYDDWRIRIILRKNITEYIENNEIYVDLEYEMEFQDYRKTVPLVFESYSLIGSVDAELYAYDFTFSLEGKEFWLTFHKHFFNFKRPWFNYPISPQLPLEIRSYVESIEYNYVPDWGYLTLREFMDLFRGMKEKRWDEFCFWNNYQYDDSAVCGDIRIEDDPDSMHGAKN